MSLTIRRTVIAGGQKDEEPAAILRWRQEWATSVSENCKIETVERAQRRRVAKVWEKRCFVHTTIDKRRGRRGEVKK